MKLVSDLYTASICMFPCMYPAIIMPMANRKHATRDRTSGTLGFDISLYPSWSSKGISQWHTSIAHEFVISWFKILSFNLIYSMIETHVP